MDKDTSDDNNHKSQQVQVACCQHVSVEALSSGMHNLSGGCQCNTNNHVGVPRRRRSPRATIGTRTMPRHNAGRKRGHTEVGTVEDDGENLLVLQVCQLRQRQAQLRVQLEDIAANHVVLRARHAVMLRRVKARLASQTQHKL